MIYCTKGLSEYPGSAERNEGAGEMEKGQIVLRLLVPPYQDAPEAVQPTMAPLHHPPAGPLPSLLFQGLRLLTPGPNVRREAELHQGFPYFLIVIAFVQTQALGLLLRGSGRLTTILAMVARTSFMSCWLAPSTTRPRGTPWPSVSRLRLTPPLPRSVGLGPVFFPPEGGFGHRPVHAQPGPVNALQLVKPVYASLPEFQEHISFDPLLKPGVGGGLGAHLGLIQGFPLAASAQDVENGISALAVWHPWPSTAKAVSIHPDRQQRLQHGPEFVRDAEPRRGAVVGCPRPRSFWFRWFTHVSEYTRLFG